MTPVRGPGDCNSRLPCQSKPRSPPKFSQRQPKGNNYNSNLEAPKPKFGGTQTATKTDGTRQVFKTQKTCHFDTPSVLIPLWVLQKRHPNGYQNKRVPKCLVFKNQHNCHFDAPSVAVALLSGEVEKVL